ncbi:MAG: cryptochrome/photolyase family protein [Acidimicrobiales bacterium]
MPDRLPAVDPHPGSGPDTGDCSDCTVLWFRRDLRLADHPALCEAADRGPVLGLFVVDPALTGPSGPNRLAFLRACLTALDESMGSRLVVRRGDPVAVVPEVAAAAGAVSVLVTGDHGPYGRRRDQAVAAALAALDGWLERIDSPYAVAPGSVTTRAGRPFKMFTPFARAWAGHGWDRPLDRPDVRWVPAPPALSGPVGLADAWPAPAAPSAVDMPGAGEEAAHRRLDTFVAAALADYADDRDRPDRPGTSHLSSDLKFGTIHPRQVLDRLTGSASEERGGPAGTAATGPDGPARFRLELAWREFYADVLANRPDSACRGLNQAMAAMDVDTGPDADERFEAWRDGRTGYPVVDAGMRQLAATGWMHNRVRMITASFLVKDLHLDWTRGARWFMHQLVDGDLASNSHGWQWVAGTGTDAAPYFRVFNPTRQGERFDPDGAYVRRWVPELAGIPGRAVHQPWRRPGGPPPGYPLPLVDHGEERAVALARYRRLRERGR